MLSLMLLLTREQLAFLSTYSAATQTGGKLVFSPPNCDFILLAWNLNEEWVNIRNCTPVASNLFSFHLEGQAPYTYVSH